MTEYAPQLRTGMTAVILSPCGENDAEKRGREWRDGENITNREDWVFRKVCFTSVAEVTELEK